MDQCMISNFLSDLSLTLDFTGPPIFAHQARYCTILLSKWTKRDNS